MRACSDIFCPSGTVFDPERSRPSAMLHSNVAIFNSVHAARTMLTACISSDVSITTIGVEELISTFRRSSPSVISYVAYVLAVGAHQLFLRAPSWPSWLKHYSLSQMCQPPRVAPL